MIAGVDENVHRHVEICEIDDNKSFSIILKQEYYKLFMSEAIVFLVLFLSSVNACHGEYFMIKWDPNKKNPIPPNNEKNKSYSDSDNDFSDEQSPGCSKVFKFNKEILCVKG